jgi:hypothetical protein
LKHTVELNNGTSLAITDAEAEKVKMFICAPFQAESPLWINITDLKRSSYIVPRGAITALCESFGRSDD